MLKQLLFDCVFLPKWLLLQDANQSMWCDAQQTGFQYIFKCLEL